MRSHGISALYPPQAAALKPALQGRSVLLACPTASGKSLVAYLTLIRAALAGRTGLYLVPLRALAHEKGEELRQFESLGIRVAVSVGDYDLSNEQLGKADILIATSEKADALLRKGHPWLDRLAVAVADEIHLMRDPDRGPTLEVSLTRLRRLHPALQIVALSATVGNSTEVARWLGAEHIASDFRPVQLRRGVWCDDRITYEDGRERPLPARRDPLATLVEEVIDDGGQALVFVNSRKASESVAAALAPVVARKLDASARARARAAAEELVTTSEEATEGIRRLAGLLPNGVAFHNASLLHDERSVIERAFKDRALRALVATPTLAAGINLPARRVVVRDTTRYSDALGMQAPIPAMEIQQMLGRAGRPRFDRVGEALLLARRPEDQERLLDAYLRSPPEDVESRLAAEPALRMHLLALVASGAVRSETELEAFFRGTFYGQTLSLRELAEVVGRVRAYLEEKEFLSRGRGLTATAFGELTSELYLDPVTATVLRSALEKAPLGGSEFPLLAAIAATPDLPPLFLRRGEEPELMERMTEELEELLVRPDEPPLNLDIEMFLATLKTAELLEAWIDETPIVEITERFGIGAGDLRAKVEDANWLLFAAGRLAQRFQRRLAARLDDLSLRVQYGVRADLLDLVRLRGVGRVRARALLRAGVADREALRAAPWDRVEAALGSRALAEMVLRQVRPKGEMGPPAPPRATPAPPRGRRSLRLDEFPGPTDP
ncbi:MAG: DEAD/DEAH box helicase [Thermoplasmata archaeon]